MKRKPRAPSARLERRLASRSGEKLWSARERLLAFEAGGSPARPMDIATPALVEPHALSVPCPRCEGQHELLEHAANVVDGQRLREARLRCRQCGSRRSVWFRLVGDALN